MSSLTRHQTDKVGVFFVLGKPRMKSRDKAESAKPDKIYYIMYRLDGKKIEEKVGRESERMTPAKAAKIREQRVNGISLPNTERRRIRKEQKQALESRWTIARLWDAYKINKPDLKGLTTDENRYKNYLREFADRTPEEICTGDIDHLRLRLIKAGKRQEP